MVLETTRRPSLPGMLLGLLAVTLAGPAWAGWRHSCGAVQPESAARTAQATVGLPSLPAVTR